MEDWAYRVRRARIALTLTGIVLIAGSLAAVVWLLVTLAARQDAAHRVTILVLALLPVPYLLVYLLGMKKGYSPLRRYRLARRMRGIDPHEHPHRKAAEIWDWLPFHRHGFYAASASSLAEEEDPAWFELAEANNAAKTATGAGFDVLVVLKKGPINALAGELPGVGTWCCVSRKVVESLDEEGLMAILVHELFHGETGELRARNTAMDLHDLGVFAVSFVVYYLCVGLVLSSVPADWSLTELPLLSLLVLLLWAVIKLYSRMADRFLFPEGSCRAADEPREGGGGLPVIPAPQRGAGRRAPCPLQQRVLRLRVHVRPAGFVAGEGRQADPQDRSPAHAAWNGGDVAGADRGDEPQDRGDHRRGRNAL